MFVLEKKVIVSAELDAVWEFFSSPANLKLITPAEMGFDILTGETDKMYPGQMISYCVKPLFGMPLKWITEITHVEEKRYFVDEQRYGPYRLWHHEHHFRRVDEGVEMIDRISYILPFGIIGRLAHRFFVKSKVNRIFEYRSHIIEQLFPVGNRQNQ